jgi:excisionase family DNA binding protein
MGELLTLPEAALMLRLRVSTLREWRRQRRIPIVKLGRRVFIRRHDVEMLVASSLIPAEKQSHKGVLVQ